MDFYNQATKKAKSVVAQGMESIKEITGQSGNMKLVIPHKVKEFMEDRQKNKDDENLGNAGEGVDAMSMVSDGLLSESDKTVNLAKLIAHMDQVHPRNEYAENFGMWQSLGSYENPYFKIPCLKSEPITEMAKEIGIGPTMFLMSVKQLIKIFLVFTMLNMPIYVYLSKTHDVSRTGGNIFTFFASFTMGALGQGEPTCSEISLTNSTTFNLTCGHPFATIEEINTIGIAQSNKKTCATAQFLTRNGASENFLDNCFNNKDIQGNDASEPPSVFLQQKEGLTKFNDKFKEECKGKNTCKLDFRDLEVSDYCGAILLDRLDHGVQQKTAGFKEGLDAFQKDYTSYYNQYNDYKKTGSYSKAPVGFYDQHPTMMITYNCRNDVVVVSGGAGGFEGTVSMTKSGFSSLVVFIDILCTLILMAFYKLMERQQADYFKKFDTETLQVTDFSWQISNMPVDEFFNFDDNIFRMRLWLQFEKILQDQGERENPEMPNDFQDNKYQLTDIQFAKNDNKESQVLFEYIKHKKELEDEQMRLKGYEEDRNESKIKSTKSKIDKCQEKLQKDKDKYKKMKIGNRKLSIAGTDTPAKKPSSASECFKKKSTLYTFVTFRSMDGKTLFQKSYDTFKSKYLRFWVLFCGCCCPKTRDHLKSLYIGNKWPVIEEPLMADNILWENLPISARERRCRIRVANSIGALALLLSFLILTGLNGRSVTLKNEFKTPVVCPTSILKQQAYDDHVLGLQNQVHLGLMHCFCNNLLMGPDISLDSADITFNDIKLDEKVDDPKNGKKYCDDWAIGFAAQKSIYAGQAWILAVVNAIIQATFTFLVVFQKRYTQDEQTQEAFKYKAGLMYMNNAIIPLFTSFKLTNDFFNGIGMFNGAYNDFSVEWYREIGATICYSMFLQTFQPHFNLFIQYAKQQFKQYADRGYKKELKSEVEECNTKCVMQEDIEALYTGPEVDGSTLYSNFLHQLYVTFTYSGGLPVLYFIAFLNYITLYWSYKFLFIKYYQKTIQFNEGVPMRMTQYIKIGIGLHFIVTFFMLTNKDIMEPENGFGMSDMSASVSESSSNSSPMSSDNGAGTGSSQNAFGQGNQNQFGGGGQGQGGFRRLLVEVTSNVASRFLQDSYRQKLPTFEEAKADANRFGERFSGTVALYYLIFVGVTTYIYYFRQQMVRAYNRTIGRFLNPIINCIIRILKCLYNCFCKCCEAKEDDLTIFSDDLISELKMQSLYDILKRSEREYKAIRLIPIEALPWDCDPQMIQDAKISLKQRIQSVQERIDKLVQLALKEAGASHSTPMVHDGFDFNKLSPSLKWMTAVENSKLIAKRIQQERMPILRMKGVTQSYDMYDSQLYKKAKTVMKEIIM